MTFFTVVGVVLMIVMILGLLVAVFFGLGALRQLERMRKTPPPGIQVGTGAGNGAGAGSGAGVGGADPSDPANDVPAMRFKGEAFEADWQGSRGYETPQASVPAPGANWTDRLIVPVLTPFRPSRFSDPSYWTRYLMGVLAIFFLLPLLLINVGHLLTNHAVGSFTPSAAQLGVPTRNTDYLSNPSSCHLPPGGLPEGLHTVSITDADNGRAFTVHAGDLVAVTYYYGKPVFSPDVPLCDPGPTAVDSSRVVEYQVSGTGTGSVYIPQPSGTVVAEIEVSDNRSGLFAVLAALALVVVCVDLVILWRLRRAVRARPTPV